MEHIYSIVYNASSKQSCRSYLIHCITIQRLENGLSSFA